MMSSHRLQRTNTWSPAPKPTLSPDIPTNARIVPDIRGRAKTIPTARPTPSLYPDAHVFQHHADTAADTSTSDAPRTEGMSSFGFDLLSICIILNLVSAVMCCFMFRKRLFVRRESTRKRAMEPYILPLTGTN